MEKQSKPNREHLPKAYENSDFINSSQARSIRILAEYYEPQERLRLYNIHDTVVFYGSARIKAPEDAQNELEKLQAQAKLEPQKNLSKELAQAKFQVTSSQYYQQAEDLAYKLTEWSMTLEKKQRFVVCSGGGPGIMEAANRGADEAGGRTVGMNISLPFEQDPNPYITEKLSFEFHYFFMRKFWFVYLAKALVVFPGGFGTMDEFFELLTLIQTGKVTKPLCVIMYGTDFWNKVVNFDEMIKWGVIDEGDMELFHPVNDVDTAFETLKAHFEKEFLHEKEHFYL